MPEPIDAAPGTTDYTRQLRQHIADAIEDTARRCTMPQPGPMYGTLPTGALPLELADAVLDVVGPELARWKSAGSSRTPLRIVNVRPYRTWYGRRYWRFECSTCVIDGGRFPSDSAAIRAAEVHVSMQHGPTPASAFFAQAGSGSTELPRGGVPLTASQANTAPDGQRQPLPPERPSHGHTEPRLSRADRVVAYRSPGGRILRCLLHVPDDTSNLTPVTSDDLLDGGMCTYPFPECGRDVLTFADDWPIPRKVCRATRTRTGGGYGSPIHETCWETYGHNGSHAWRRNEEEDGCPTPLTHNWGCGCPTDELPAEIEREQQAMTDLNGAYRERAQLLAWLATFAPAVITPATDTDEPGWQLLYLNPGHTQLSWHISPRDADLFAHVEHVDPADPRAQWDGHSTEEKYERIALLAAYAAADTEGSTTP